MLRSSFIKAHKTVLATAERTFVRSYASSTPATGNTPAKPSTRAKLMRYAGAATAGTVAYMGYHVYNAVALPGQKQADPSKPHLVIVGSGWGSVATLKTLDFSKYNVTVISSRNYFLFTPLLPSTATGLIEQRSIMEPTRAILRKKTHSSTFVEGEVIDVDPFKKTVTVSTKANSYKELGVGLPAVTQEIPYDKLIMGVGSTTNTFGIKGVSDYALFMKEVEDSIAVRKRIMDCMEAASTPGLDPETRRRLMHTVIVGAGPTGVECAGEIHDFVQKDMAKFNPEVVKDFKVSLLEVQPHILAAGFNQTLVDYATETLKRESVDIMTKTMVTGADAEKVYATRTLADGTKENVEFPYGLFIWAGGIGLRPVVKNLFAKIPEQNESRRGLRVDEHLRVIGADDFWALGDCADAKLAPTAQVASQEGAYLGKLLGEVAKLDDLKLERSKETDAGKIAKLDSQIHRAEILPKFEYAHQGSLAYIGDDRAVADITWFGKQYSSSGFLTYIFWRSAYLSMVFSFRNKFLVAMDWTKAIVFGRDLSRE